MAEIDHFLNVTPVCVLYFFYGLAFLFLGISIVVKDKTKSELRLAKHLWLLAGFGFAHGAHEWLELYLLFEGRHLTEHQLFFVNTFIVFAVVLSFFFLLQFGLSLIRFIDSKPLKWLKAVPSILFVLWLIYLFGQGVKRDFPSFESADFFARNTLGVIGGLTTAFGLMTYSREARSINAYASKSLYYAGVVFLFYTIFTGTISSRTMISYFSLPIEALRGISAILIACFIIKGLTIFDAEKSNKLENQFKLLAQSEKLASLGHLAAGIAHEINNPLTNVSLNIQTLKNRIAGITSDAGILQKLDAVERNVDRASAIAKELLQFSRQRESEFVLVNINETITSALTLMGYKLNNVTLRKKLSVIPDVMGDPLRLEQVFINILSNAVESMPDGGDIDILTSIEGAFIKIEISDTGSGISDKNILKAFDPFFTTKDVGEGTGLGLSICYGIINQHNGNIEIANQTGKGTTVTIKLPASEGNEKNTGSR